MSQPVFHLETRYVAERDGTAGKFVFRLVNLGERPVAGVRLAFSSLVRLGKSGTEPQVRGAIFLGRVANFHEFAAPEHLVIEPGAFWEFEATGLTHVPRHRLDGPKSAYSTLTAGERVPVSVGDLQLVGGVDSGELRDIPEGCIDIPLAVTPWPNMVEITSFRSGIAKFVPENGIKSNDLRAIARIGDLMNRLFPAAIKPFDLSKSDAGIPLKFTRKPGVMETAYEIDFSESGVCIAFGDSAGRDYALTTLAQMHHGAVTEPEHFRLPLRGRIADAPRFSWRGAHLDVSRHFWPGEDVKRFLDILAWHKMNLFQWHLTDDEGWRIEIKALPDLTGVGAWRGPDCALPPQGGDAGKTYGGFYTQEDVVEIIAHAAALHVDILPEIDIPGHCFCVLAAYPHLADPDEMADSYRSVQGYPNNALNPAVPATYEFMKTVFGEVAALFPYGYIHVGADEVDTAAWMESPLARKMMEKHGYSGTMELQAHFLRWTKEMLKGLGKDLAGWDEVSLGGGVGTQGTMLVAWQTPEVLRDLAAQGYKVVSSPGQAYYLDMAQASGWDEPGASWAGVCSVQQCYDYEASGELPENLKPQLVGVQAGIWCEHMISRDHFNHMVFPRLGAVAEAGWTRESNKKWLRFAALSRLAPML